MGQYCFACWRLPWSVVVCRRLSPVGPESVTLHGGPAGGFTRAGQLIIAGGPVVLRTVRATPCFICSLIGLNQHNIAKTSVNVFIPQRRSVSKPTDDILAYVNVLIRSKHLVSECGNKPFKRLSDEHEFEVVSDRGAG